MSGRTCIPNKVCSCNSCKLRHSYSGTRYGYCFVMYTKQLPQTQPAFRCCLCLGKKGRLWPPPASTWLRASPPSFLPLQIPQSLAPQRLPAVLAQDSYVSSASSSCACYFCSSTCHLLLPYPIPPPLLPPFSHQPY
ncbi:hypothetical protein DUNSADRAFT_8524 [Dunaliella salina]|uniref:Encoded protein n=1 Tax=Dunaliella salina TaxID=3046 RepID=A0ABQ7GJB8_DUNSA|nr:hypothetical protein DUNSADRAFT_8524 [Dunaliella salina]|eukprot:KAF5834699.1 hypothetical protein DUNSADRAFT_8524 [Dunaliella salina]